MGGQSKDRAKTTPAVMCIKILLHIFNLIYFVIGACVLGVGIWTQLQLKDYMALTGLVYDQAAYVMIGVGVLIVLVALGGFVCTAKDKIALLYMYAVFISLLAILQVAAGIAGAIFSKRIDSTFEEGLKNSIKHHSNNMKAWDRVQEMLQCCGVDSPADWTDSTLGNNTFIPPSCCKGNTNCTLPTSSTTPSTTTTPTTTPSTTTTPTTTPSTTTTPTTTPSTTTAPTTTPSRKKREAGGDTDRPYTRGCHAKIVDKVKDYLGVIIGVCVGFVALQIIGAVLACCLAKKTSKNNYEQIY